MFYNIIRVCIYPVIFLLCIFSGKKRKFFFRRFFQNLNFLDGNKEYIWIHCSSVGEINLSEGLIKKIKSIYLNKKILISTFTDTGYATGKKRYKDDSQIDIIYFPVDDYFQLRRIFKRINVDLLILVETEIWPNLIELSHKYSKILLVNGRISDRSFKRYLKIKGLMKPLLEKIDYFCMQSEKDKKRIISLGARDESVENIGNLKFDINFENYSFEDKENLKKQLKVNDRKILVAGSTRIGEDEILMSIYKKLENHLLIIVPRHLERVEGIKKMAFDLGLKAKLYPEDNKEISIDTDVIIVNKMGVLRKFYSIGDATFVGGTLVDVGGHSLLEPLFYGKTPIFGPYLQNVKDISKEILNKKIGYKVSREEEFILALENIEKKEPFSEKIKDFFQKNRCVVQKVLDKIEKMI